jgi:DNA-binding transcriptional regulator YdaS (Cro superfamily)
MSNQSDLFGQYVKAAGGRSLVAASLGVGVGMVGHIICGRRDISPRMAIAIERSSSGQYRADDFLPEMHFTRDDGGQVTGYKVRS